MAACLLGGLLMALGHWVIADRDAAMQILSLDLGWGHGITCFMEVFPCGVGIGMWSFVIGSLLFALGIAAEGRPHEPHAAIESGRPSAALHRWAVGLVAAAFVLSVLTALASLRTGDGTAAVVLWLVGIGMAGLGMTLVDHGHGTPLGNPFTRREWLLLAALVTVDLLWVAHDLGHWRWSGTPDEAFFYAVAKAIALGQFDRPLLSEEGVFGYHPVLSSFYQGVFMRVFGINVFGWRLSSAAALAISLPFLYLFARELWNRRTAWAAAALFGSAQLAVGFGHLGYNNAQVYPIITAALGMLAWAQRRRSVVGYFLSGCVAGLGFYTFYAARIAPLLVLLLAWHLTGRDLWRRERRLTVALLIGIGITVLPACVHIGDMVGHMLEQTSFRSSGNPEETIRTTLTGEVRLSPVDAALAYVARVVQHFFLSLVYGLWYKNPSHLQLNPIVDPLSESLAATGLWLCLLRAALRTNARFLLLAFALIVLLIGATSQYDWPPLTRLLLLSPFTALLAAVALNHLMSAIDTTRRAHLSWVVGAGLAGVSVLWSIAAVHDNIYHRMHGYRSGIAGELVRLAQQLPGGMRMVYVQREDTDAVAADMVLAEYNRSDAFTYIRPFNQSTTQTLQSLEAPCAVFYTLADAAEIAAVENTMRQRFPNVTWRDSDPGTPWNLRYFYVLEPEHQ
jgi:4-amino-4-deoxy-L-arabinose transferase-like glycosyltransferase